MKYIKQFFIILSITFVAELLNNVIPLPIPASIYGLVLMLTALITKVIKVEQVENVAKFLIEIMPLMFIPAGVGLITSWEVIQPFIIPISVITVLTTIIVMVSTGKFVQLIIGKKGDNDEVN